MLEVAEEPFLVEAHKSDVREWVLRRWWRLLAICAIVVATTGHSGAGVGERCVS